MEVNREYAVQMHGITKMFGSMLRRVRFMPYWARTVPEKVH